MRATRLEPGEETTVLLSLSMGMHEGMDGPHLFQIDVPVTSDGGEMGTLDLYFQAHFGSY
ncbi:MAG: hypothetical protein ACE5EF_07605 [Dehalococcoidia bacterium]